MGSIYLCTGEEYVVDSILVTVQHGRFVFFIPSCFFVFKVIHPKSESVAEFFLTTRSICFYFPSRSSIFRVKKPNSESQI